MRAHRFKTYKFRRQHPVIYEVSGYQKNFYIADFYCAFCKLIVELDGKYHEWTDQKEYDRARDIIMTEMGLTILRIKNEELTDLKTVLHKIEAALKPHLTPLHPMERGGE